jgi:hypothetical protein
VTPIPLPPSPPLVFFGQPLDLEGLAGTIDVSISDRHADFFTRGRLAVLIEQTLGPRARYAAWFEAPRSLIDAATQSSGDTFETRMLAVTAQWSIDRHLRPWIYGDGDRGWPSTIEPFRSLALLGGLLASVRRRLLLLRWRYKPKARTLRALLRHDHPDQFPRT